MKYEFILAIEGTSNSPTQLLRILSELRFVRFEEEATRVFSVCVRWN